MKRLMTYILVLISSTAFAESASDAVQAKLNAIHSMSANFTQTVNAGKREVANSSGMMAILRPGRFRWQTNSPMKQLVVADSERLWVYDIELEQVTVKKQEKGVGGTPGLFLSGNNDNLARDFDVTTSKKGNKELFNLKAKSPKENYQRLTLIFNGDTLCEIEFFDQLGQHTIVHLSQIKNNPTLATTVFHFKPPKGVDVVQQ